jgi:hypothetical protein
MGVKTISMRTLHGVFWGMVATPVAALVPLTAMALGIWPAPESMGRALAAQVAGPLGFGPLGFLGIAVWALLYGGFWGGMLAAVSGPLDAPVLARPSTLGYGVSIGLFRAFVGNLTAPLWLRWGPFGLLLNPKLALGILITDLVFGIVCGWLLAREDWDRIRLPYPRAGSTTTRIRLGPT